MMKGTKHDTRTPRRRWIASGAGVAILAGGVWFASWGEQQLHEPLGGAQLDPLRCEPDEDFSASYRLRLNTELKLNAAALIADPRSRGRLLSSSAGYGGRLRVRALESRDDATVLAMQVDDIEPTAGSFDASTELATELGKPFFVVLQHDCRISQTGFAEGLSAEAINRQQALVTGLSLVVSGRPTDNASGASWTSKEHDSVGEYTARYDRGVDAEPRTFSRQRTAYLNVHAQVGQRFKEALLVRILSSTTKASLDEQDAWLAHLESKDHLQITRADASLVADVQTTVSLDRELDDQTPLEVALSSRLRWRSEREPPLVAEVRPVEPPAFMKSVTLEDALAQYTALLRSGKPGAIARGADYLALMLRAQPRLAFDLMGLLKRGQMPPDLESTVFLALELSGTPESHDALIEGLADDHAARNRARAAAALPDVPHPSQETLAALTTTAEEAVAETKDETRLVRNSAIYALGTLEGRTRSKDVALADATLATLRGQLAKTQAPSDLTAALDAIGNSGNPAFIQDLKPHLGADSTLVRAHAIEAMGRMDPQANKAEFRGLIGAEQDPQIRGAIARTYADQARRADSLSPPEVVHGALDVLTREPDPRVRGQLIDLIGPSCASDPQAMQALAAQFKQESDPLLLKAIGRYVPADKLGS